MVTFTRQTGIAITMSLLSVCIIAIDWTSLHVGPDYSIGSAFRDNGEFTGFSHLYPDDDPTSVDSDSFDGAADDNSTSPFTDNNSVPLWIASGLPTWLASFLQSPQGSTSTKNVTTFPDAKNNPDYKSGEDTSITLEETAPSSSDATVGGGASDGITIIFEETTSLPSVAKGNSAVFEASVPSDADSSDSKNIKEIVPPTSAESDSDDDVHVIAERVSNSQGISLTALTSSNETDDDSVTEKDIPELEPISVRSHGDSLVAGEMASPVITFLEVESISFEDDKNDSTTADDDDIILEDDINDPIVTEVEEDAKIESDAVMEIDNVIAEDEHNDDVTFSIPNVNNDPIATEVEEDAQINNDDVIESDNDAKIESDAKIDNDDTIDNDSNIPEMDDDSTINNDSTNDSDSSSSDNDAKSNNDSNSQTKVATAPMNQARTSTPEIKTEVATPAKLNNISAGEENSSTTAGNDNSTTLNTSPSAPGTSKIPASFNTPDVVSGVPGRLASTLVLGSIVAFILFLY